MPPAANIFLQHELGDQEILIWKRECASTLYWTWFWMLQDFSTSWDIKATPTFFFLKDGQEVDKLVGANKPELQKKIVAITDSVPESRSWLLFRSVSFLFVICCWISTFTSHTLRSWLKCFYMFCSELSVFTFFLGCKYKMFHMNVTNSKWCGCCITSLFC